MEIAVRQDVVPGIPQQFPQIGKNIGGLIHAQDAWAYDRGAPIGSLWAIKGRNRGLFGVMHIKQFDQVGHLKDRVSGMWQGA